VVPSDKNFSTTLFLTLVHGSVSFNQVGYFSLRFVQRLLCCEVDELCVLFGKFATHVLHATSHFSVFYPPIPTSKQLRAGQDHLQQHLMLQSSRRENLVRLHFGLFVQCAEGLEFLKAYRKGGAYVY